MTRLEILRVVLAAIRPHMADEDRADAPSVEEAAVEAEKAMAEEPQIAAAFDAAVMAIATEARRGWRPM